MRVNSSHEHVGIYLKTSVSRQADLKATGAAVPCLLRRIAVTRFCRMFKYLI